MTAFDSFALRAFEVNALDYLLKPVNPERLKQTIEKLFVKTENKIEPRPLDYDDRLFIESGTRSQFLKIASISHIIAAGDYSEVLTIDGKKLLTEKSLREWETRLPEKHFARIHRGTIINLECVERVETWFNRTFQIHLKQFSEPFDVSRRYAVKIKSKFG